jgi:hypothetical protein
MSILIDKNTKVICQGNSAPAMTVGILSIALLGYTVSRILCTLDQSWRVT